MKNPVEAINIVNLDHLGIVAGIIDEMELVEEVNKKVGLRACIKCQPRTSNESNDFERIGFFERPNILIRDIFCRKSHRTSNRRRRVLMRSHGF